MADAFQQYHIHQLSTRQHIGWHRQNVVHTGLIYKEKDQLQAKVCRQDNRQSQISSYAILGATHVSQ